MPFLDLIRAEPAPTPPDERTNKPTGSATAGRELVSRSMAEAEAAAADEWTRQMRAAFAPARFDPPAGCLGPIACARLGSCDRHAAGRSCPVDAGGSEP